MNTTPMARLAVAITLGFFAVLGMLMFAPVRIELKDPLLLMLGALIGNFNSIVSFYFGTTSSSQKKDETITELTKTAAAVATTAQASQVAADVAAAQPQKTGEVQIQADSVTVDTPKGTP
jgi:hypothetical protein